MTNSSGHRRYGMFTRIRRRGFWYSLGIAVNRVIPSWLFRMRWFTLHTLAQPDVNSDASSLRKVVRVRSDDEIRTAIDVTKTGNSQEWIQNHPVHAWLIYQDDECIGGVWVADQLFDETDIGIRIEIPEATRWLFSASVRKEYREQGAYKQLLENVLQLHPEITFVVAINPTNLASVRAHQRFFSKRLGSYLAFHALGVAFCLRLGGLKPDSFFSARSSRNPIVIKLPTLRAT